MENKKKILVVEDEIQYAKMIAVRLQSAGYDVSISTDAYGGTQSALRSNPDLIILDLMMPAGGGFSLLDRISKIPMTSTIPVIILTGRIIDDSIKKTADKYGVKRIIRKPYEKDDLLNTVETMLS